LLFFECGSWVKILPLVPVIGFPGINKENTESISSSIIYIKSGIFPYRSIIIYLGESKYY